MSTDTVRKGKDVAVRTWCEQLDAFSDGSVYGGDVAAKRFGNPIAYNVDRCARDVIDYLYSDDPDATVPESLDDLCRILALRDTTAPSEIFTAFFRLRSIVDVSPSDGVAASLSDDRIEACILRAIDLFVGFREQILTLRIDELKREEKMLERYRDAFMAQTGEA